MSVEKTTSVTGRTTNQAVQKPNVWSDLKNEKKFMDALASLMEESWATVSQVRERSGMNPNYQLSEGELSKRIEEVSQKLTEKYKEVATLEAKKAQLLSKSGGPGMSNRSIPGSTAPRYFQPVASATLSQQQGYSGNIDISYSDLPEVHDSNKYFHKRGNQKSKPLSPQSGPQHSLLFL
ncbi:hypothetical protein GWI33_000826 [Rhynchophorus ferrugineus]|uniref:Uncharacterized protein n=1 Tax=Rhynchophorus ferrugineus TaxID=354439 RepID=A0A834HSR5_RHYFE|nr:hypothetical protein GWI33_000826 [Rhynchophorus ferrugineus]